MVRSCGARASGDVEARRAAQRAHATSPSPNLVNPMKQKATFFHAGCPVCVSAEQAVVHALDTARYELDVVHLGDHKARLAEARELGVASVPALCLGDEVFHINFGAKLDDLG